MNKILVIGNVTNEPDKRATQNGTSVCSFTVAVNRRFPGADGQKQTDFYRVNTWRGLADVCGKYVTKGSKVAVVGELQPRMYEAKDGTTRLSLEVSADEVEFMTRTEPKPEPKPEPKQGKPVDKWQDISSDDLPWQV